MAPTRVGDRVRVVAGIAVGGVLVAIARAPPPLSLSAAGGDPGA